MPVLCGLAAAICVAAPTLIAGNDFGALLISALSLFGVTIAVFTAALILWRKWRISVLLAVTYASSLWFFAKYAYSIHDETRWISEGSQYKAKVLQDQKVPGQFQHVEWDSWGGLGAGDTSVYLVFDPTNSLAEAARNHSRGKVLGIPCGVSGVRRLDNQWYEATTYTDTDWNQCN